MTICVSANTCVHMILYECVSIHGYMYIWMYECVCVCGCMCLYASMCVYAIMSLFIFTPSLFCYGICLEQHSKMLLTSKPSWLSNIHTNPNFFYYSFLSSPLLLLHFRLLCQEFTSLNSKNKRSQTETGTNKENVPIGILYKYFINYFSFN